jgi:hypothetical protein
MSSSLSIAVEYSTGEDATGSTISSELYPWSTSASTSTSGSYGYFSINELKVPMFFTLSAYSIVILNETKVLEINGLFISISTFLSA